MLDFYEQRAFLVNEFEEAEWIQESGMDEQTLTQGFCEYLAENKHMSPPLLRAGAFRYLLKNCQISINPHSIFCQKMNLGVHYSSGHSDSDFLKKQLHEAGPDIMENYMFYPRNRELQERLAPDQTALNRKAMALGAGRACADFRHASPDWAEVFRLGFSGLRSRLENARKEKEAAGTLTEKQRIFYDAAVISYDAILMYLDRVIDWSEHYKVPEYTAALRHLRHAPPQTTYQAMIMTILFTNFAEIGYEKVRTLGLLDLMYEPFYRRDCEQGRCSDEEMKNMLRFFFHYWNAARRGAQQPFGLGGSGSVTYLMLEVYEELNIINPKLHMRCSSDVPEKLLRRVAELIRKGSSSIVLINDEAVYRGYDLLGIPRCDSKGYLPMGCYEPFIMGKEEAYICASWLNIAKQVEFTVTGGVDLLTGETFGTPTPREYGSFSEFLEGFYSRLHEFVEQTVDMIDMFSSFGTEVNPSPVLSATMTSCVEKGTDIYDGGMVYNNSTIKAYGIGTTVDALLGVKKLVFEDKAFTLPELARVLKHNWEGFERQRQLVLNDEQKYGNHLRQPDALAREIYNHLAEWIIGRPNSRGGVYRLGADSVDFALTEGEKMGASADGRLAREPISKNIRPVSGMQRNGITAFMLSALNLGQERIMGSAPLDFMVHPSAVQGEDGLNALVSAIRAYFAAGGMALQGNVVSYETLLAARDDPEKYADLQVRVCGWNDYFVNLSPAQQEQFLRQAKVCWRLRTTLCPLSLPAILRSRLGWLPHPLRMARWEPAPLSRKPVWTKPPAWLLWAPMRLPISGMRATTMSSARLRISPVWLWAALADWRWVISC